MIRNLFLNHLSSITVLIHSIRMDTILIIFESNLQMNQENSNYFYKKYPGIFTYRHSKTEMKFRPIDCGDGWKNLIDKLCESVSENFIIEYIETDKYGALQIQPYSEWSKDETFVKKAEFDSLITCQFCGKQGNVIENQNIVSCQTCLKDKNNV
jgi:hypothetical protein